MANTRQSAKRAKQNQKRNKLNHETRSATKTAVKAAFDALKVAGAEGEKKAKDAYLNAIKSLSKAASKGVIPKKRASRKISRLTTFINKTKATVLNTTAKK
jgi:small subunit ribosomal protein S20